MSGEKTEQPTDKHLRNAREEGQVAKSQEIPATSVVLAVFVYVWIGFDWICGEFNSLIILATQNIGRSFHEALKNMSIAAFQTFAVLALPCVLFAAVAGALGHLLQTGTLFAWKAAAPKLDKLNPKQWFSKVFSMRNLMEFLRSILKLGVVISVFYLVFMDALPLVLSLPGHGLPAVQIAMRQILRSTATYALFAFIAIAAADWLYQRHQFLKQHMMSKEDVKNEYKEMEGDPQIKGQRRQLHQEMAMNDQMQSVRNADVLVTNPTHFAIAIEYKPDKTPLPVILAKGQGVLAERMIQIANEAGIPIMRNVPLARDLWDQGQELQYIPSDLIEPVAEVLAWLDELRSNQTPQ